jgi:8-oxo-dGTP diphosphatase
VIWVYAAAVPVAAPGSTIVILTAMNLEYRAVRAQLSGITAHTHPMGTQFEVGQLSGCRVALALTGKGNQSAAVLTERAAAEFTPAAVIFVGVAGALQPHLGLGDVVVATHVYAYHGATSQDDGMTSRPRSPAPGHQARPAENPVPARHHRRLPRRNRPQP